jgi:hypothetical protein
MDQSILNSVATSITTVAMDITTVATGVDNSDVATGFGDVIIPVATILL